jgi:hypothetical protein
MIHLYGGRIQGQVFVSTPNPSVTLTESMQIAVVDTLAVAATVIAPAAPSNEYGFIVYDDGGDAATNPITVDSNGNSIEDPANIGTFASTVTLSANGCAVAWIWDGSEYKVVSSAGFGTSSVAGGFSDDGVASRIFTQTWLRRNEANLSGGAVQGSVVLLTGTGIPALKDFSSDTVGSGLAILGDKLFFVGYDEFNGEPGALYGLDLFTFQSVTATDTPLRTFGDSPLDLIGVRGGVSGSNSSVTNRDYLFGVYPNDNQAFLGYISGPSGSMVYTPLYGVSLQASFKPVRACYLGLQGAEGNPWFAYTCTNGNVYVLDSSGTSHLIYTAGHTPTALAADDFGHLWVLLSGNNTILQLQLHGTSAATLLDTLTVGSAIYDLVATGRNLVAAYNNSGSLALRSFDLLSGASVSSFNVGTVGAVSQVRLTRDQVSVWVAYQPTGTGIGGVYRINPESGDVLTFASAPFPAPASSSTRGIVLDSSGTCWAALYNATSLALELWSAT